ncbi:hypothetical protein GCM10019059_13590 [Camelimonas fluminis]|nr:hypothetical protein GCM10019059_13590 [Camelimonas fluminis]
MTFSLPFRRIRTPGARLTMNLDVLAYGLPRATQQQQRARQTVPLPQIGRRRRLRYRNQQLSCARIPQALAGVIVMNRAVDIPPDAPPFARNPGDASGCGSRTRRLPGGASHDLALYVSASALRTASR